MRRPFLCFVIHCVLLASNPLSICDTQDPLTPYGSRTQRASETSTENPGFTELNNIYSSECLAEFHNAACSCCSTDSLWTLTTVKARPYIASSSQVFLISKKNKNEDRLLWDCHLGLKILFVVTTSWRTQREKGSRSLYWANDVAVIPLKLWEWHMMSSMSGLP